VLLGMRGRDHAGVEHVRTPCLLTHTQNESLLHGELMRLGDTTKSHVLSSLPCMMNLDNKGTVPSSLVCLLACPRLLIRARSMSHCFYLCIGSTLLFLCPFSMYCRRSCGSRHHPALLTDARMGILFIPPSPRSTPLLFFSETGENLAVAR
jgi:hypothetical protein